MWMLSLLMLPPSSPAPKRRRAARTDRPCDVRYTGSLHAGRRDLRTSVAIAGLQPGFGAHVRGRLDHSCGSSRHSRPRSHGNWGYRSELARSATTQLPAAISQMARIVMFQQKSMRVYTDVSVRLRSTLRETRTVRSLQICRLHK